MIVKFAIDTKTFAVDREGWLCYNGSGCTGKVGKGIGDGIYLRQVRGAAFWKVKLE